MLQINLKMPPKKTNSGASKKVETKKKEKIIEVSSDTHMQMQQTHCTADVDVFICHEGSKINRFFF